MTTSLETITDNVNALRDYFNSGKIKDVNERITQLNVLKKAIRENEKDILAALKSDLNKSGPEAYMAEVNEVISEIDYALKHVKKWVKPRKVRTHLLQQPAASYIYQDPLGVVLIIGPWNYPFMLVMAPLVGAIASGNSVLLKPSELAPQTSRLIARLMQDYFDPGFITVVEGGVEETTAVLNNRFDHIFFTGGEAVGKIVMRTAAENLTPVTLELGGKSPCIVDKNIDINLTAKRIAWGKYLNAGQTCVAPDYLLVNNEVKDELVEALRKNVISFFGTQPAKSSSYGRIINGDHFMRLNNLLGKGNIVFGGETNESTRFIAPTLIDNVSPEDPVMCEEVFGPILTVLTYNHVEEAIRFVVERPKPLALYVFSNDKSFQEHVLNNTSSRGVCVNDTIIHITSPNLPFGGVGTSGMGSYHGKASFNTFSHRKSVMKRARFFDIALRYPPFKPYLKHILKMA